MTEKPDTPDVFVAQIAKVTAAIADREPGSELESWLNDRFSADSVWFEETFALCRAGCDEGWLCENERGGVKFGRAVKEGDATHGFSVDVVEMTDVVGPHHSHPNGEIDLVMPLDNGAEFDGRGAGWKVYAPQSAHCPRVRGGKALVLYLLPGGAIEFTRN